MTSTLHDDAIDTPTGEEQPGSIVVRAVGLHDGPTRRLQEAGAAELTDSSDNADLVVVSTRLPRRKSASSVVEELIEGRPDLPVFVLAHPGGEAIAVEFMRAGARAVIAEGNESQLLRWVGDEPVNESLLETFEREQERHGSSPRRGVTLGRSPFEARVYELCQSGTNPRVALARVEGWSRETVRLSPEALDLLERRLSVQFQDLCRASDAEMYFIGPGDFGIIGKELTASVADTLGQNLSAVATSFSPGRTSSLGFAMGHVGPEVTSDPATLLEMARRALELAADPEADDVVNADDMSRSLASSTELDTAFKTRELLEAHDPTGASHGDRVADLVTRLAEHLGLDGRELTKLRLAAQLHDLGKVSLPDEDRYPEGADTSDAYRSHPGLGAEALQAAGADVAAAVRHHHERWDGDGFPDGLSGEEIPVGARLIAIADAIDRHSQPEGSPEGALARIEEQAGTVFDPELVSLASQLFSN